MFHSSIFSKLTTLRRLCQAVADERKAIFSLAPSAPEIIMGNPNLKPLRTTGMENQNTDRRREPRFSANLPAEVQLLRPEDTFTPMRLPGIISDISERGVRIKVEGLTTRDYLQLIRHRQFRFVRVHCAFPTDPTPARLFGAVVCFDYHGKGPVPTCDLGVSLGENEPVDLEKLRSFVASLRDQTSSPA